MDWNTRVSEFVVNGEKILKFDFSNLLGDEVVEMADFSLEFALNKNRNDLLILYDATDTQFNKAATQRLKFITKNYGYIRKKSAVLGMSGVRKVFFNGFMVYTENKMRAFKDYDAAIEYLTKD